MKKVNLYTYEAIIEKQADGYFVRFPQFPDAHAEGNTRKEAIDSARDALLLALGKNWSCSEKLPPQEHIAEVVTLCVALTQPVADSVDYMTMQDAADFLGVGLSRVSQLIKAGKLEDEYFKGVHMVSVTSVNAYHKSPRKPGRPFKTITLDFDKPVDMEWIGELQSDYPIFQQDRWKGTKLVSFESQGGYDPALFKNLKTDPFQYEGKCHFGDGERDCVFSVGEDDKFYLVVKHMGDGDNQLFEEGNKIDSLTIYVRTAVEGVFEEDFIG